VDKLDRVCSKHDYKVLIREPEGKIILRGPWPRWEDIKSDLK
jgi:hypothetical protein